ncbi:hypothetical protein AVHY2522_06345 [Acidovorax sp. SUPP2522]|uniref:hypothetical protein n=1 Tax=unclassified Acidovorax TaxID=2684926 RepID=UPI00234AE1E5|nr:MULTISPECIES: hypothetical protein [unclassified Acidovorax]WCM96850.1 hypothetical protein M5C96_20930 [Acidovorax sp. GBBC 1281]GKT14918.1 hypothetical protein AVHY2522_06345 [Acidovorax sp. SUPP2522]
MSISVAGRQLQNSSALSESGRHALAFVDGGPQWLDWAIASPGAHYHFPDETALLDGTQKGLHGSPMALLPGLGLAVSPVKLMTLGLSDLRTLALAEAGDASPAVVAQVQRVLQEHRLLTAADLRNAQAFLASLGVAGAPVFQCIDFMDWVALCELPGGSFGGPAPSQPLQSEAAKFGVDQARTPREFADYYRVYLHLAAHLPELAQASAAQRSEAAQAALYALLPALLGALDGPVLSAVPTSPAEVRMAVYNWLAMGRRIGFSRPSEGVRCIVEGARYRGETGAAAARIVDAALQQAMAVLAANDLRSARLGQDGATMAAPVGPANAQIELQVSSAGLVSLTRLGGTDA